ncbi:unnamed protein product [Symbiodinium natans]|uniref:Uncharacterized protein n=1 Tax=Symbiodinium natans TaxID=878477 RepID=A0A812RN64_9DINO|nr:unnamed protein product [Symbiodinium natans]
MGIDCVGNVSRRVNFLLVVEAARHFASEMLCIFEPCIEDQLPPEKSVEDVKPLEKKKQGLRKTIRDLERDIAFAEDDQERTEARLAKHKAHRAKILAEIDQVCQQVEEGKQNQAMLESQVQQAKLQLEEVCAARDRLKEKVSSEAQELQIVEVELKRASMELESAKEEKLHLDVKIFHQTEENKSLKGEHQRMSLEAAAVRAQMLAAREETDEATKAGETGPGGYQFTSLLVYLQVPLL